MNFYLITVSSKYPNLCMDLRYYLFVELALFEYSCVMGRIINRSINAPLTCDMSSKQTFVSEIISSTKMIIPSHF